MRYRDRYQIQRRPPAPSPQRPDPFRRDILCVLCGRVHAARVYPDGWIERLGACPPASTSIPSGGDRRRG